MQQSNTSVSSLSPSFLVCLLFFSPSSHATSFRLRCSTANSLFSPLHELPVLPFLSLSILVSPPISSPSSFWSCVSFLFFFLRPPPRSPPEPVPRCRHADKVPAKVTALTEIILGSRLIWLPSTNTHTHTYTTGRERRTPAVSVCVGSFPTVNASSNQSGNFLSSKTGNIIGGKTTWRCFCLLCSFVFLCLSEHGSCLLDRMRRRLMITGSPEL